MNIMEQLKSLFGDKPMTFEDFKTALESNKEIKLANLAGGQYVDKQKLVDAEGALSTANATIGDLQTAVKKFDGVDVDGLKDQISQLQAKYNSDTQQLKLNSVIDLALVGAKARNPKLAKAAIDMSLVKLDGDKLVGLDEQLAKLKESDAYLFEPEADPQNGAARIDSGAGHGQSGNVDYDKMSDDEYYKTIMNKKEQ